MIRSQFDRKTVLKNIIIIKFQTKQKLVTCLTTTNVFPKTDVETPISLPFLRDISMTYKQFGSVFDFMYQIKFAYPHRSHDACNQVSHEYSINLCTKHLCRIYKIGKFNDKIFVLMRHMTVYHLYCIHIDVPNFKVASTFVGILQFPYKYNEPCENIFYLGKKLFCLFKENDIKQTKPKFSQSVIIPIYFENCFNKNQPIFNLFFKFQILQISNICLSHCPKRKPIPFV